MYQQWMGIGNLGNDPEMRYTPAGTAVCSFRLAVNRTWTDNDGNKKDKTTWFRITTWKKQAEIANQYLKKGSRVLVVGEIEEPNVYTNKAGEPAASLEVTAQTIKFLSVQSDEERVAANVTKRLNEPDVPF